jgi:hypothetical protein
MPALVAGIQSQKRLWRRNLSAAEVAALSKKKHSLAGAFTKGKTAARAKSSWRNGNANFNRDP